MVITHLPFDLHFFHYCGEHFSLLLIELVTVPLL